MKLKLFSVLFLIIFAGLVTHCASEAAPGGGPPDKTPPSLVNVSVITGSTSIAPDQEIVFNFSENIDPDNIEKNVLVFPISNEVIHVRTRGRNLSVSPDKEWDPNVVYTLIIGKGVSDIRGNNIEKPIQISFTSGKEIPKNKILGKVNNLDQNISATIAISRKNANPDSVLGFPEYYTQVGPDGDFTFEYLPKEEFYLAGYLDLDESNSYKAKFDGVCIPVKPSITPDTTAELVLIEAVYENFLPGVVIKAESLDPQTIEITFTKNIGEQNGLENFRYDAFLVDSVIFKKNSCILYHQETGQDSFSLSITELIDQVGIPFADSSFYLPSTEWPDSFFHREQVGNSLRISPDPGINELEAEFQSRSDTSKMFLKKQAGSFYRLTQTKSQQKGTCLISLPSLTPSTLSDSLYSVDVEISALPEFGAVLGKLDNSGSEKPRLLLFNHNDKYEIAVFDNKFHFEKVLEGTYTLAYYLDKNDNSRRDRGRPFPHESPEILHVLDKGIEVRARWDTDLEEPYKIVIENDK